MVSWHERKPGEATYTSWPVKCDVVLAFAVHMPDDASCKPKRRRGPCARKTPSMMTVACYVSRLCQAIYRGSLSAPSTSADNPSQPAEQYAIDNLTMIMHDGKDPTIDCGVDLVVPDRPLFAPTARLTARWNTGRKSARGVWGRRSITW